MEVGERLASPFQNKKEKTNKKHFTLQALFGIKIMYSSGEVLANLHRWVESQFKCRLWILYYLIM